MREHIVRLQAMLDRNPLLRMRRTRPTDQEQTPANQRMFLRVHWRSVLDKLQQQRGTTGQPCGASFSPPQRPTSPCFMQHLLFLALLNLLLFIDFTIIIMTGLLISKSVTGTLGITLPHDEAWKQLHFMASDGAIYLTGLHLAVNWRWVVNALKSLVRKPVTLARTWAVGGTK